MENNKLGTWFELSYASFLTLPRVLMQEMPDEWQDKMADLLNEYDQTFDTTNIKNKGEVICGTKVMPVDKDNKFMKWPDEMLNYRHPCMMFVNSLKYPIKEGFQKPDWFENGVDIFYNKLLGKICEFKTETIEDKVYIISCKIKFNGIDGEVPFNKDECKFLKPR